MVVRSEILSPKYRILITDEYRWALVTPHATTEACWDTRRSWGSQRDTTFLGTLWRYDHRSKFVWFVAPFNIRRTLARGDGDPSRRSARLSGAYLLNTGGLLYVFPRIEPATWSSEYQDATSLATHANTPYVEGVEIFVQAEPFRNQKHKTYETQGRSNLTRTNKWPQKSLEHFPHELIISVTLIRN